MKRHPFEVVQMFEDEVADYTGAPYCVTTTSCTEALFLSLLLRRIQLEDNVSEVTIPVHTYLSVPQSIIQAGYQLEFEELEWKGVYELKPLDIWDAAKRLSKGMYRDGSIMCLSFHHKKHLKIGKGGAILLDDKNAMELLKRLRYEGRTINIPYHKDKVECIGYNMYMTPEQAARGLTLLWDHPDDAPDLIEDPPYRDLRTFGFINE